MKISKLAIKTKSRNYDILIGSHIYKKLNILLKVNNLNCEKALIVLDKRVPKKLASNYTNLLKPKKKILFYFKASEKNKSQKNVLKILDILFKNDFQRNDCLISIGGGITGDLCGFASSIFKRGIKFINIPSTLLAQVDSAIGGKTGVNSKDGKNMIGSFYQPHLVISDISFLNSLPKREVVCGYAEILKHSLISNKKFFTYLNKNANYIFKFDKKVLINSILESCKIKKKIVEKDENEKGLRKSLNFGHTFAHSFEAVNKFSKNLNHGEAVLLGILCASNLSNKINLLKNNDYETIKKHFENFSLLKDLKKYFKKKDISKIISFMKKDKKNTSSNINLILIKKIGKIKINSQFSENFIKKFLSNIL